MSKICIFCIFPIVDPPRFSDLEVWLLEEWFAQPWSQPSWQMFRIAAAMASQICFGIHRTMSLGSVVTACHLNKFVGRWCECGSLLSSLRLELVMPMVPNHAKYSPVSSAENQTNPTHCRCFGSTGLAGEVMTIVFCGLPLPSCKHAKPFKA